MARAQRPLDDTRALADAIAKVVDDKLGDDIVLLEMADVVSYTDWFVIGSGRNSRQTQAIAEEIRVCIKRDFGLIPARIEGAREGTWILLDYVDVVCHLFTPEAREYYRLEHLWGQVPVTAWAS